MVVETKADQELFPAESDDGQLSRDDDETDDSTDEDIARRLTGCIFCELGLECLTHDDIPDLVSDDDFPELASHGSHDLTDLLLPNHLREAREALAILSLERRILYVRALLGNGASQ
jgi:hypothetical protein